MTLADDLRAVRLAAELAVLERVSVGAADPRVPVVAYLHDAEARARLHHGSLRPDGSHRRQLDEVRTRLQACATAPGPRLATLGARAGLAPAALELLAVAAAYDLDLDARELLHALAPRRRAALWLEAIAEVGAARGAALATPAALLAAVRAPALQAARLLEVDGDGLAATVALRPAARAWLLGDDAWPEPTRLVADPTDAAELARVALPDAVQARLTSVATALRRDGDAVVVIRGARGSGRRAAAHALARALDRPLLTLDARRLLRAAGTGPVAPLLADALAGATWRGALALLLDVDALLDSGGQLPLGVEQLLRHQRDALLLATAGSGAPDLGRAVHEVPLGRATLGEREAAWRHALAPHADAAAWAPELAARYVLGAGAVAGVVIAAERSAPPLTLAQLDACAASRLSLRLGAFGTVIARKARFAELVLPDDTVETLHDMVAMVASRAQILERWDFGRHLGIARGVSALFSGDPGTGKTMAASVLASALGLELVRIDLAAVVSKYVGETEKNLATIFDEAQDAHAMLLFDEADGLFAKRTEVKSAQDRFANLEVGYLLQRMESFDGVSVLTTNLEASIDAALLRRLNFRVRFPTPEPDERVRLWRQLVPPAAVGGATLDVQPLADAFAMSGGYIKNAIVRAGVIAARAGRLVTLDDLWSGAHAEYAEMGKVTSSLHRPA